MRDLEALMEKKNNGKKLKQRTNGPPAAATTRVNTAEATLLLGMVYAKTTSGAGWNTKQNDRTHLKKASIHNRHRSCDGHGRSRALHM